jgi:hypothetical protein
MLFDCLAALAGEDAVVKSRNFISANWTGAKNKKKLFVWTVTYSPNQQTSSKSTFLPITSSKSTFLPIDKLLAGNSRLSSECAVLRNIRENVVIIISASLLIVTS